MLFRIRHAIRHRRTHHRTQQHRKLEKEFSSMLPFALVLRQSVPRTRRIRWRNASGLFNLSCGSGPHSTYEMSWAEVTVVVFAAVAFTVPRVVWRCQTASAAVTFISNGTYHERDQPQMEFLICTHRVFDYWNLINICRLLLITL